LYLDAFRYSISFGDLIDFLDTFGPSDLRQSLGSVMAGLYQKPLSAEGVDVLPFIKILRSCEHRIQIAEEWTRKCSTSDLATHLVQVWYRDSADHLRWKPEISCVRLKSSPHPETLPNGKFGRKTMVRVDIIPSGDSSLDKEKAFSVGNWFTRDAFFEEFYELSIESHCGSFSNIRNIDRDSWYVPCTSD
jgi:hypothetical protein